MSEPRTPKVAIVDYGMGNLFSVRSACRHVHLDGLITSSREEILAADAVIVPGVGAFGDAMATLHRLDLVEPLRDIAAAKKPLVGICLGMQLLMNESSEFGRQIGLGIIPGAVVRFEPTASVNGSVKVPQVCWNQLRRTESWGGTLMKGLPDGVFMYFLHSFYVKPEAPGIVISTTRYGDTEFCSSLRLRNIFACQWHPERSGTEGLVVYQNLAELLNEKGERNL
jgi:glutamine amidotransferase